MRVILKVVAGPHEGKVFTFSGHDTFLVGRSPRAHLQLPKSDRYVSRSHFLLEINPPACRLMDLNSRNGTYVNGEQVKAADLKHQDKIKVGHTHFVLEIDETREAEALDPEPMVPPEISKEDEPETQPAPDSALILRLPYCPTCHEPLPGDSPPMKMKGVKLYLCSDCQSSAQEMNQFLPGYLIISQIGVGSMGEVYLAIRTRDGMVAALKTVLPTVATSQKQMQLFTREIEILQQLRHPNIVQFYETGESEGHLYFVMDYIRGDDAQVILDREGPLAIPRAVNLICQLLEALHFAHSKGYVHRDIKPGNILVSCEHDEEHVKLGDFGVARAYVASHISGLTMMGDLGGTVPFMAPEQILNYRDVQPTADQYSAAATLYTLLTGKFTHDFPTSLQEQLKMVLDDQPVPIRQRRKQISSQLAQAIHQALAPEADDRFVDAKAFQQALLATL